MEQNGYTLGRSTVHGAVTLLSLLQIRREYKHLLWIAYVDLKAAVDSVDHNMLWLSQINLNFLKKTLGLIRNLHTDTFRCIHVNDQLSAWFEVNSGIF